jgi:hypothetical protein
MCPGVDSASKNEYQETYGGKDGRFVRMTTLPPSLCRIEKIRSLNLPDPQGPAQACSGNTLPYGTEKQHAHLGQEQSSTVQSTIRQCHNCIIAVPYISPIRTKIKSSKKF